MSWYDQSAFRTRLEWSREGAELLAASVEVLVVIDVLRFTTMVDVAVSRGASVEPVGEGQHADPRFALLSPSRLDVSRGQRLVVASPNGSMVSRAVMGTEVTLIAGCLRNASAVAAAVRGRTVGFVAAGERRADGSLRPCVEDWLGAGAVAQSLDDRSPEADAAAASFDAVRSRLADVLLACGSGRELVDKGYRDDVLVAAELDVSATVPTLGDGAFR